MEDLALAHPFRSCIANEANDYCGMIRRAYALRTVADCCPIEKVSSGRCPDDYTHIDRAAVFNVQDVSSKKTYCGGAWTNRKLVRDATIVMEKNPKLTQKIVSKKESRATASENRV